MTRRFLLVPVLLASLGAVLVFGRTRAESAMLLNPRHQCSFCHSLHGGGTGEVPLGAASTVEAVCLGCHHPDVASTLGIRGDGLPEPAEVHTNDPTGKSCCGPFRVTCTSCHEVHSNAVNYRGNENLMLVKSQISAYFTGTLREVVFEARADAASFCDDTEYLYPFPDGTTPIRPQICDVCHGEGPGDIGRHWFDGSQTHHQSPNTCTQCHTHGNSLSP